MNAGRRLPLRALLASHRAARPVAWFVVVTLVGMLAAAPLGARAAGPQGDWVAVVAAYDRGDHATALRLLKALADKGDADAQYDLAVIYHAGEDVPADHVQAYRWYSIAASRFTAPEMSMRDRALKNRDRIAASMTPAEIAEAQRLAREWTPR